jgi:hypothetical protein
MNATLRRLHFAAGLTLILSALPAFAETLSVGPGKSYASIATAVAASHDGDTVEVDAGIYNNDFAEIGRKITLTAVGGFAHLRASGDIPNRKAILITDTDVTINGFYFSGAQISADDGGNGAGIRYQAGNLVVNGCYFVDNQDGILGVGDGKGSVTVSKSEFFRNGAATGPSAGLTHNLYLGGIARLEISDSYFHGAQVGHEFKSRAGRTVIKNSRFVDGPTGTASYSLDLPNGGDVTITDSQIEQGPLSQNPAMIGFGEEGNIHPGSKLVIQGSLIVNELRNPSAFGVWNAGAAPVKFIDTKVFGLTQNSLFHGPANLTGIDYLAAAPAISTKHPWEED